MLVVAAATAHTVVRRLEVEQRLCHALLELFHDLASLFHNLAARHAGHSCLDCESGTPQSTQAPEKEIIF
jgi:hypothetical protein